jgi:tetratricopeptide (TPR) repeat protein
LAALVLCACHHRAPSYSRLEPPAPAALELVQKGMTALRSGALPEARDLFRKAVELDPQYVEAHAAYQDALRLMCRPGLALEEYRQLVREEDTAVNRYLLGRLSQLRSERRRAWLSVLDLEPDFPWAHLGLGMLASEEGELDQALMAFRRAARALPHSALPSLRAGEVFLQAGQPSRAAEEFVLALQRSPAEAGGEFGLAESRFREGRTGEAFRHLRSAVTLRPESRRFREALVQRLRERGAPRDLEEGAAVLIKARERLPRSGGIAVSLAEVETLRGEPGRAVPLFRRARELGEPVQEFLRDYRLACVRLGLHREALEAFLAVVPRELLLAGSNVRAPIFQELIDVASTAESGGGTSLPRLARAYHAAGWVEEAAVVADLWYALQPGVASREAAEGAGRSRDFLRRITRTFDDAYEAWRTRGEGPDFEATLRELERIAATTAGITAPASRPVIRYPLMGAVLDPRAADKYPITAYLRSVGHHLLVGRRAGGPVEAYLMPILVETALMDRPLPEVGSATAFTVIGHAPLVRSFREGGEGGLGGATFEGHYFLSLDFVLDWWGAAREWPDRFPGDGGDLFADEPFPAASEDEALDLAHPLCVEERIYHRVLRTPGPDGGLAAFLSAVETHEQGHLADVRRYLPLERNLPRAIGLLFRSGFSAEGVEASLEGRAGLYALRHSEDARVTLAQMVGFLPEPGSAPPHSEGYHRLLQAFVRVVHGDAKAFPSIDRRRNVLQQLDRLTDAEIREAARRLR